MDRGKDGITLRGVGWATYNALRDPPSNPLVSMSYLDGTLDLMMREPRCRPASQFVDLLLNGTLGGLGLELMAIGTTTLRRGGGTPRRGAGKEPDSAYYLGENERQMRGRRMLDLAVDPPPDLVIEVDGEYDDALALPIYARIGVPEVWRIEKARTSLRFARLAAGTYSEVDRSAIIPRLTPSTVLRGLAAREENYFGDNEWMRWLREWARALPEAPASP